MAQVVTLVTQIPCNSISKKQSEYLNVRVNYSYQGPAKTGRLGAVVTQQLGVLEFDEIGSTRKEFSVNLPDSPTGRTGLYSNLTGMPLAGCEPKSGYGLKVYALDLDGKPEWGCKNILTITSEVELETLEVNIDPAGAGYVTTDPAPAGGTQHNWQFPKGTTVYVTAHPNTGYTFKSWSGEMTDTTAITAPVYAMTEKRTITAHFEKVVVTPPKADIQNLAFAATKGTYKIGDYVPFSLSYEYKGKAQSGQLVLSLGTGVPPSFFTVQNYSPMMVAFAEAMNWVYKSLSSTFVLTAALEPGKTYNTRAKLETLEDLTQETDTDWGVITISTVPVGVSFQVSIWGVPAFGSYQKWCCYYWDPSISNFVGDGKWYNSYDKIAFSNVKSGGYLAVYLKRDSTISPQYTSPTFQAVSGGIYQYDVQLGRVEKIG